MKYNTFHAKDQHSNVYDANYIQSVVEFFGHHHCGGCTEVRIFPKPEITGYRKIRGIERIGSTVSGYFSNYEKLAQEIAPFDGKAHIYITLNPVQKDYLALANNRLRYAVGKDETTKDVGIFADLWFFFDVDPLRNPPQISSTSTELSSALERQDLMIREQFEPKGITVVQGMSGNGGHGLIRLAPSSDLDMTRALKKQLLDYLSEIYSDDVVSLDTTVHNPSRLIKLHGVMAVKGDNIPERPHRRAYLEIPDTPPLPIDLKELVSLLVPPNWKPQNERQNGRATGTQNGRATGTAQGDLTKDDRALIEKAMNAKNGDKFSALWEGRWGGLGFKNQKGEETQSEADLALCSILAFWTQGDAARIDRLFRQSGLMREKWERADYRERTINLALDQRAYYDPNYRKGNGKRQQRKNDDQSARNGGEGASQSESSGAESADGSSEWLDMEAVLREIRRIDEPTPRQIQKLLWDRVVDASHWSRTDFGRFCDTLNAEYGITKTWLEGWKDAVIAEKRKRGEGGGDEKTAIEIADELIAERYTRSSGEHTLVFQNSSWYSWEGTKYIELSLAEYETVIVSKIRQEEGMDVSQTLVTSVRLATQPLVIVPNIVEAPYWRKTLTTTERIIALKNGLLDLDKYLAQDANPLLPQTPDFFVLSSLPYDYIPDAKCQRWRKFLEESLRSDPDLIWVVQEFYGLCQTHDTRFHVFLFLQGDSRTGKGVAFEVLQALTGYENVANVPLRQFGSNFGLQPLIGKKLNINAEIPELDEVAEDVLKEYCGGETMLTYNRKHKESISTRQRARLAFSSNHFPNFRDRSEGIWERMLLVPFHRVVPEEERDPDLADYLCENELPGIFNWAMEGYARLVKNGRFTDSATMRMHRDDYRDETTPVRRFLKECVVRNDDAKVTSAELYDLYIVWAKVEGHARQSHVTFGRDAAAYFRSIGVERKRVRGKGGGTFFVGVEISSEIKEEILDRLG